MTGAPRKSEVCLIDGAHWLGVLAIQGLVIGLMRVSDSYEEFQKYLEKAAPPPGDLPLLEGLDGGWG